MLCIREAQNVSYPKGTLLVEGYEEGYCRFRLKMYHMSAGKSRTSEACRTITVTPDPSVEMGENHYGFCGRPSDELKSHPFLVHFSDLFLSKKD